MSKPELLKFIESDLNYIKNEVDKYLDLKTKDDLYEIRQKMHELRMAL